MFVRKDFWINFIPVKKDHHIFIPKACMTQLGKDKTMVFTLIGGTEMKA